MCGSQLAVCLVSLFVCVCVSLVRVVIICLASTHTALVSSPSLAVLHLTTYLPTLIVPNTVLSFTHIMRVINNEHAGPYKETVRQSVLQDPARAGGALSFSHPLFGVSVLFIDSLFIYLFLLIRCVCLQGEMGGRQDGTRRHHTGILRRSVERVWGKNFFLLPSQGKRILPSFGRPLSTLKPYKHIHLGGLTS